MKKPINKRIIFAFSVFLSVAFLSMSVQAGINWKFLEQFTGLQFSNDIIADSNQRGWFDVADCSSFQGWACDPNQPSSSYKIGFYEGSELVATGLANSPRESAVGAECGGNSNHGFVITVPASLKDGKIHTITAKVLSLGTELQGNPKTISCLSNYDAEYVTQEVPESMCAGQLSKVFVTMKNTGSNTWTKNGNYRLGSQNPPDNMVWGIGRVEMEPDESIATNQQKTFNFGVTAPSKPGTYAFEWKMLQESITWFGDATKTVYFNVVDCSSKEEKPTCKTLGGSVYIASDGTGYIGCDIETTGSFNLAKSYCTGTKTGKIASLLTDSYGRPNRYYATLTGLDPKEEVKVYIASNSGVLIECLPSLNKQTTLPASCYDSDGTDAYSKGYVAGTDTSGNSYIKYDECSGNGLQVNERYCYESPTGSGSYADEVQVNNCQYGCKDGACIKPKFCLVGCWQEKDQCVCPIRNETNQTGSLYVQSNPLQADAYVDDLYRGKTPITITQLSVNTHKVNITMQGYNDYVFYANINSGQQTTSYPVLKPKTTSCTDSDGTNNYKVKGTCTDASGSKTDACSSYTFAEDYYCITSSNTCAKTSSNCEYLYGAGYTCSDGACIVKSTEIKCDLALKQPVKASGYWSDGYPENVVKGVVDPVAGWRTKESTGAWIYVDLGKEYNVNNVVISWGWDTRFGEAATSKIQASNDATTWKDVATSTRTRTNNERKKETLEFTATKARYVRFYGSQWNGGWADMQVFEVYGTESICETKTSKNGSLYVAAFDNYTNSVILNANVQIGSSTKGITPLKVTLEPKEYYVAVSKDGYIPDNKVIKISSEVGSTFYAKLTKIDSVKSCSDSDGDDPYKFGNVINCTGSVCTTLNDYCYDDNNVIENRCNQENKNPTSYKYSCPYIKTGKSCSNGACQRETYAFDLFLTDLAISNTASQGVPTTVTLTIKNVGTYPTNYTGFGVSEDGVGGAGGGGSLSKWTVLKPGETINKSFNYTFWSLGEKRLRVTISSDADVNPENDYQSKDVTVLETKIQTCDDSDGGKNYDTYGTVTVCSKTSSGTSECEFQRDYCNNNSLLNEYYCNGNSWNGAFFNCPNGCSSGVCINGTTSKNEFGLFEYKSFEDEDYFYVTKNGKTRVLQFKEVNPGPSLTDNVGTLKLREASTGDVVEITYANLEGRLVLDGNTYSVRLTADNSVSNLTVDMNGDGKFGSLVKVDISKLEKFKLSEHKSFEDEDYFYVTKNGKTRVLQFKEVNPGPSLTDNVGTLKLREASTGDVVEITYANLEGRLVLDGNTYSVRLTADNSYSNLFVDMDGDGLYSSYVSPVSSSTETKCTDSDGGINYYQKGITRIGDNPEFNEDFCGNNIRLAEFYCNDKGGTSQAEYFDCPDRCVDGACIPKTNSVTDVVLKPSGNNNYKLSFTNKAGVNYDANILGLWGERIWYGESTGFESGRRLIVLESNYVYKDEYFVVSSNLYSRILQLKDINPGTSTTDGTGTLKFRDVGTKDFLEVTYSNLVGVIFLDGNKYEVTVTADRTDAAISVDMNGDGMNYGMPKIFTSAGVSISFSQTDLGKLTIEGPSGKEKITVLMNNSGNELLNIKNVEDQYEPYLGDLDYSWLNGDPQSTLKVMSVLSTDEEINFILSNGAQFKSVKNVLLETDFSSWSKKFKQYAYFDQKMAVVYTVDTQNNGGTHKDNLYDYYLITNSTSPFNYSIVIPEGNELALGSTLTLTNKEYKVVELQVSENTAKIRLEGSGGERLTLEDTNTKTIDKQGRVTYKSLDLTSLFTDIILDGSSKVRRIDLILIPSTKIYVARGEDLFTMVRLSEDEDVDIFGGGINLRFVKMIDEKTAWETAHLKYTSKIQTTIPEPTIYCNGGTYEDCYCNKDEEKMCESEIYKGETFSSTIPNPPSKCQCVKKPSEGPKYDVKISKGWNLLSPTIFGDRGVSEIQETDCSPSDFKLYSYFPLENKYGQYRLVQKSSVAEKKSIGSIITGNAVKDITSWDGIAIEGITREDDVLLEKYQNVGTGYLISTIVNSWWIRSETGCEIKGTFHPVFKDPGIINIISEKNIKLAKGWNFLMISPDIAGYKIDDFKGTCNIPLAYGFEGTWTNMNQKIFPEYMIGKGMVVRTTSECVLGFETEQGPPPLP